jgi:nitrogen regulatory protein A
MRDQPLFDYQQEINKLRSQFQFDFVSVALVQPAEERFILAWKYVSGNLNDRYQRIRLQSGKGIAGIVFKTGKPMLIKHVNKDFNTSELFNYPIVVAERLQSLGAVPLWFESRVVGVLLFGFRHEDKLTETLFERVQEFIKLNFGPFSNGLPLMQRHQENGHSSDVVQKDNH